MTVKPFLILKEIDSLSKMRITQLSAKTDQEERLIKLNDKRQGIEFEISSSKKQIIVNRGQLDATEQKLKVAVEQKQRLIDMGGDEGKIAIFERDINFLEDQGLEYLSLIDEAEQKITELKTFLSGLERTLDEISQEVREETSKMGEEIKNIDLRLELLMEELPSEFKTLLIKTTAKKLAHGPFTRIDQGSCFFCRFKISRIEESEIDMQKNLKTCPQCSRIFLPYGA